MSKWCAQYLLPEPHDNAPSIDFGRDIPYQSLAVTKVVVRKRPPSVSCLSRNPLETPTLYFCIFWEPTETLALCFLITKKLALQDIEEMIYAPKYGLKGQLDASVRVKRHAAGAGGTPFTLTPNLQTLNPQHSTLNHTQ